MAERFANYWSDLVARVRKRWGWFGYILSGIATVYLLAILAYGGYQVRGISWKDYWLPTLLSILFCLVSNSFQFFVWTRLISAHNKMSWNDVAIYARYLMLKRLPGGLWQWVGRTSLYSGTTTISSQVIVTASFVEWIMLLVIGSAFALGGIQGLQQFVRYSLFIILIASAFVLAYRWQANTLRKMTRLSESVLWIMLYGSAWILGGLIVFILAAPTASPTFDWLTSTWIWAVSGSISFLIVFIPAGLGIREISLTWLLKPYLATSQAVLVAILIRLALTIADAIWGILGSAISSWVMHRK